MSEKKLVIGAILIVVGLIAFARFNNNQGISSGPDRNIRGEANINGQVSDRINQAPDFSLESLDGGTITLSQYRGEKPVILDFFATWCPNCQRDMPKLNKWYEEKYKDQVEVIGIDLREDKRKVEEFVRSRGISFPIVLDPRGQVAEECMGQEML